MASYYILNTAAQLRRTGGANIQIGGFRVVPGVRCPISEAVLRENKDQILKLMQQGLIEVRDAETSAPVSLGDPPPVPVPSVAPLPEPVPVSAPVQPLKPKPELAVMAPVTPFRPSSPPAPVEEPPSIADLMELAKTPKPEPEPELPPPPPVVPITENPVEKHDPKPPVIELRDISAVPVQPGIPPMSPAEPAPERFDRNKKGKKGKFPKPE